MRPDSLRIRRHRTPARRSTFWLLLAGLAVTAPRSGHVLSAEPGWLEIHRRGPFVFHADFSLDPHHDLLTRLEALPRKFRDVLALPTTGKPIHVHLLADRRRYRDHLSRRVPGGSQRRALYLRASDRAYVFAYHHDNWERDLRHECTHALIHNALPYLPLWLDEGLAEYFEEPVSRQGTVHRHINRLRWSLRFGWSPSIRRLESRQTFASMRTGDYREAWAWVHFLLHGPPVARRALTDYLTAIRHQAPPGHFSRWLGKRLPDAPARLKTHLRRLKR